MCAKTQLHVLLDAFKRGVSHLEFRTAVQILCKKGKVLILNCLRETMQDVTVSNLLGAWLLNLSVSWGFQGTLGMESMECGCPSSSPLISQSKRRNFNDVMIII